MKRGHRRPVVLIFGEDDSDRRVLAELLVAVRPDAPPPECRRDPLVLVKDRDVARQRKNAQGIARQVQRDRRRFDVRAVIAHQDCDAVEPAHEALSRVIVARLAEQGIAVIAATPAWEMEAWLFLWPDAAPAVVASWSRPAKTNKRVGLIRDAKEAYRRALRPKTKRTYQESDAPRIVAMARTMDLIGTLDARSDSFESFRDALLDARL